MTFPGWGDVKDFDQIDINYEMRDKRYFHGSNKTTFLTAGVHLSDYPVRLFAEQYAHTPDKPYAHWYNRVYVVCEEQRGDLTESLVKRWQTAAIAEARAARDSFRAQRATSTVVSVTLAMVTPDKIDRYRQRVEDFFCEPPAREPATCSYEVLNAMVAFDPSTVFATTHRSHPWHGPGLQKFFQPA